MEYDLTIRPEGKGVTARVRIQAPNESDAGMWAWKALENEGKDPLTYKISAEKVETSPK